MGKKNRVKQLDTNTENAKVEVVENTPGEEVVPADLVQSLDAEPVLPEQEVVEEVVEKQPEVQPEPVKEVAGDDDADQAAISAIINNGKLSNVEKFQAICQSKTKYAGLANTLQGYQNKLGKGAPLPISKDGAAINYNLYNTLLGAANTPIYTEFKTKFDIINLCFLAYADDAFSEFKLYRFQLDWKFGRDKYLTYRNLTILICMLCDKAKRKENLKKIVLSKDLTLNGTKFTETSIQNIKRYYES